jgi:hypothetical protein
VLGAGSAGTSTIVSSPTTAGSPWDVTSRPPAIVVAAVLPDSDAPQVLLTESAVNGAGPTSSTLAELVTEPSAPVDPSVLTVSRPDSKRAAGP